MRKRSKFEFHLGWQLFVFLLLFLVFLFAPIYPVKYTIVYSATNNPVPEGAEGISGLPLVIVVYWGFDFYIYETFLSITDIRIDFHPIYDTHYETSPVLFIPHLIFFIFSSFIVFGGMDRVKEILQTRKERIGEDGENIQNIYFNR